MKNSKKKIGFSEITFWRLAKALNTIFYPELLL
jgi:hypothetical protein